MRRETEWIGAPVIVTAIAAAGTAVLVRTLSAGALLLRPFTIVRQYYHLSLSSDQTIASEDQLCALGTCVVSDQAVAIGITAVPQPLADISSDLFMYWQFISASIGLNSNVGFDSQFATSKDTDSKAMRKVNADQDLAMTVESSATSDGFGLVTVGRLLLKLH